MTNSYTLIVKSYKPTGKLYTVLESNVTINDYDELEKLEADIRANKQNVKEYSGLQNGFTSDYTYQISLKTNRDFFLDSLIYSQENKKPLEEFKMFTCISDICKNMTNIG